MGTLVDVDEELISQVDRIAGAGERNAFVRSAIEKAVREATRWSNLDAAAGSIADAGHDWDADPSAWVRDQRRPHSRLTR
jgi:Arc/MetJ family transcription regulator